MKKEPPWLELTDDIWGNILYRLGAKEILLTAQNVCTMWRRVCNGPSMWGDIDMSNLGDFLGTNMSYKFGEMCRRVIDRSQGELVKLKPAYFITEELLAYVAERSRKLKSLSIAYCNDMVPEALIEVVQKLPLLEELSLTNTKLTTEGIEALGRFCPRLKLFELNSSHYQRQHMDFDDSDEDDDSNERDIINNSNALAIAKNLPALHHLRLIGNSMTNEGLQAILESCIT